MLRWNWYALAPWLLKYDPQRCEFVNCCFRLAVIDIRYLHINFLHSYKLNSDSLCLFTNKFMYCVCVEWAGHCLATWSSIWMEFLCHNSFLGCPSKIKRIRSHSGTQIEWISRLYLCEGLDVVFMLSFGTWHSYLLKYFTNRKIKEITYNIWMVISLHVIYSGCVLG